MINALESEDLPFCGKSFIKLPRSIVNRELDTLPAERNIGFIHFVLFGKGNGWRLRAVYKPRLWSLDMIDNGFATLVFNLVGYLTGFDHLVHAYLNIVGTVGNVFDDLEVSRR